LSSGGAQEEVALAALAWEVVHMPRDLHAVGEVAQAIMSDAVGVKGPSRVLTMPPVSRCYLACKEAEARRRQSA
jgi:hypothetical protein